MLACPQDLFFQNDMNNGKTCQNMVQDLNELTDASLIDKRTRNHYHHQQQQRKDSLRSTTDIDLNSNDLTGSNHLKDKEEQVWPPEVESAFIEALESIPKLGRRKILVNGKPCGRNELISDFIFRKTCKIRTRKQVSSHIQVLKNTRKGDSHFMRLLTDSVDMDDTTNSKQINHINSIKPKSRQLHHHSRNPYSYHNCHNDFQHHLHPRPVKAPGAIKMKTHQSFDSLSSDDSSINSSPSPTDYVFDIMCGDPAQQQALSMLQFKDFYDPFQQSLFSGMPNIMEEGSNNVMSDPFFGSNMPATDIITPLLTNNTTEALFLPTQEQTLLNMLEKTSPQLNAQKIKTPQGKIDCALWPNYLCLYLEYALPYDAGRPMSHNLSQMPHCYPNSVPTVMASSVNKDKCPIISTLVQNQKDTVLLMAKTKLDLNLNISDFSFNNTSFFETSSRRTIECTTTIYSFGNVVLESKEVQQALWVNDGKYMYSFVFVNQFFDAFMKGIRSLQSWDEVDIAINNICIVQSFEDIERKYPASTATTETPKPSPAEGHSPLLVMVHEFERGNGTIEVSKITEQDSQALDVNDLEFLEQDVYKGV